MPTTDVLPLHKGLKGYNIQLYYLYKLMLKYKGSIYRVENNSGTYKVYVEYPASRKRTVLHKEATYILLKPGKRQ